MSMIVIGSCFLYEDKDCAGKNSFNKYTFSQEISQDPFLIQNPDPSQEPSDPSGLDQDDPPSA